MFPANPQSRGVLPEVCTHGCCDRDGDIPGRIEAPEIERAILGGSKRKCGQREIGMVHVYRGTPFVKLRPDWTGWVNDSFPCPQLTWRGLLFSRDTAKDRMLTREQPCSVKSRIDKIRKSQLRRDGRDQNLRRAKNGQDQQASPSGGLDHQKESREGNARTDRHRCSIPKAVARIGWFVRPTLKAGHLDGCCSPTTMWTGCRCRRSGRKRTG